jgi:hypothetical protein
VSPGHRRRSASSKRYPGIAALEGEFPEELSAGRVPGHERMEPPPEAVDLDDVPDLDAFEPHGI